MTAPPPPAPDIARLIGFYGRGARRLTVFEDGGRLFAEGPGVPRTAFDPPHGGLRQARGGLVLDARARPPVLRVGDEALAWRDLDAEAAAIPPAAAPRNAAQDPSTSIATPPAEPGPFRPDDLVDVTVIDPALRLDLRYATANNFMGLALYDRALACLQRPAAQALARAHADLQAQGFGLVVLDAYRPWSVSRLFWLAIDPRWRAYVADPAVGSKHNRGCAVDVTLCDLATGAQADMPSRYDEASPRSHADFIGGAARQRWLRERLRAAMQAAGFGVEPLEWWHFDFHAWRDYRLNDTPLAALDAGRRRG
ncbi:M15 family metallopeptidase [Caulobacter sp. KR2-114]|uniref:M15 family metallopeptidase n=1 Tax=Caulobacter sp. KR2-114 TaxID=3400912 RepID=UPI003C119A83